MNTGHAGEDGRHRPDAPRIIVSTLSEFMNVCLHCGVGVQGGEVYDKLRGILGGQESTKLYLCLYGGTLRYVFLWQRSSVVNSSTMNSGFHGLPLISMP